MDKATALLHKAAEAATRLIVNAASGLGAEIGTFLFQKFCKLPMTQPKIMLTKHLLQ